MPWSTTFNPAIPLPEHVSKSYKLPALRTLRDAADYITALPKSEQEQPHWQIAIEALILVAEKGGDAMLARIAVMRALNQGGPPEGPRKKQARSYRIIRMITRHPSEG